MTMAMFHRAEMLLRLGYDCSILTLDYNPGFDDQVETIYASGRLSRSVAILNPFKQLSELAVQRKPVRAQLNDAGTQGRYVEVGEAEGGRYERHFSADGMYLHYVRKRRDGTIQFVDHFDEHHVRTRRDEFAPLGWIHKSTDYNMGKVHQERFFAPNGDAYLSRWWNVDTGKPSIVFDLSSTHGVAHRYSSLSAWQTAWMASIAGEASSTIVCDGPGSMLKVIDVPSHIARRVGVVHTAHFEYSPDSDRGPLKQNHSFLERAHELDALVVPTEEQARDIVGEFGAADRVVTIRNVLPTGAAARPRVTVTSRVSMFCTLNAGKQVDHAIRAFGKIASEFPDAAFDIFGEGPEKQRLQALINELGLHERIRLRGYTLDVEGEMRASTCTLLTSRQEGMSYVIAESMLQQVPCVSYDARYGPSELITDGSNGLLVAEGDVTGLAGALGSMLRDPRRAREMGERARLAVLRLFDADQIEDAWRSLVEGELSEG